jgi:hypothetical protein
VTAITTKSARAALCRSTRFIVMRLLPAVVATVAALAVGASPAWGFTPHIGTYGGSTSTGHRVTFDIFTIDPDTVRRFDRDYHELFLQTPIDHHTDANGHVTWSFHHHTAHWRVKGHWVVAEEVQGTICDLVASPAGCPDGHHLQTYHVILKSPK